TVYVRITFSDKTKRDDPKFPRKLVAEGVTVNGDVQTGTTKLGKDGFAKFSIQLGLAGGEKCKVEIGTTDAYGDDVRHFETWRHLHSQTTPRGGATRPAPADYVAACAGAKLKREEEPAGVIAAGSGPAGAWIPGDEIATGMGRPALVIG